MAQFYNEHGHNPWVVEQLEDFLFFCCPECDEKCRTKDEFLQHAHYHHPNVSCTPHCVETELKIKEWALPNSASQPSKIVPATQNKKNS